MSLKTALKGAKVIIKDKKRGYTLAWFGGHGVHGYDKQGTEKFFYTTGDFSKENAEESEIRESINENIKSGDYLENY